VKQLKTKKKKKKKKEDRESFRQYREHVGETISYASTVLGLRSADVIFQGLEQALAEPVQLWQKIEGYMYALKHIAEHFDPDEDSVFFERVVAISGRVPNQTIVGHTTLLLIGANRFFIILKHPIRELCTLAQGASRPTTAGTQQGHAGNERSSPRQRGSISRHGDMLGGSRVPCASAPGAFEVLCPNCLGGMWSLFCESTKVVLCVSFLQVQGKERADQSNRLCHVNPVDTATDRSPVDVLGAVDRHACGLGGTVCCAGYCWRWRPFRR